MRKHKSDRVILVISRAWFISMFTSSISSASRSSTGRRNFSLERRVSLPRILVAKSTPSPAETVQYAYTAALWT